MQMVSNVMLIVTFCFLFFFLV